MKFKNIIFDWSGVIKDISESHLWIVNRMFKKMGGRELSLSEMRENWEEPYMSFWGKYFKNLTIEEELEMYTEAIMNPDCPDSGVYSGIIELIKKLKDKGARMAVLSFDLPDTLLPEMKKFGLENIFSDVITYVSDKGVAIKALMEKNNLNPKETIFVGDGNHEMEAGKKAGIITAAVTWSLCTEEKLKLEKPDFIVHNVKELEKILLS